MIRPRAYLGPGAKGGAPGSCFHQILPPSLTFLKKREIKISMSRFVLLLKKAIVDSAKI